MKSNIYKIASFRVYVKDFRTLAFLSKNIGPEAIIFKIFVAKIVSESSSAKVFLIIQSCFEIYRKFKTPL